MGVSEIFFKSEDSIMKGVLLLIVLGSLLLGSKADAPSNTEVEESVSLLKTDIENQRTIREAKRSDEEDKKKKKKNKSAENKDKKKKKGKNKDKKNKSGKNKVTKKKGKNKVTKKKKKKVKTKKGKKT